MVKKKQKKVPSWKQKTEDMKARLSGGRFRWLNEQLYTHQGSDALDMMQKDPSLFEVYHEGYREQVTKWPENPLDRIINWIKKNKSKYEEIGDFGCGDARISETFPNKTIHSFDLLAKNERVTACNIANVPLKDGVLDMAVFCLSLMGVDWPLFIKEAHRCLKDNALLYIVEVQSRFADTDAFVASIVQIGFEVAHRDANSNSHFVELCFNRSTRDADEQARITEEQREAKLAKQEERMNLVREGRQDKKLRIRARKKARREAKVAAGEDPQDKPKEVPTEQIDGSSTLSNMKKKKHKKNGSKGGKGSSKGKKLDLSEMSMLLNPCEYKRR